MAWHGDIAVNGGVVGSWAARCLRRRGEAPEVGATYDYEWSLVVDGSVTRGVLSHRYGDGAVALAAKVLAAANGANGYALSRGGAEQRDGLVEHVAPGPVRGETPGSPLEDSLELG